MDQWQNIKNSFKGWRRGQILWVVVVVLGLLFLAVWFFYAQRSRPSAQAPTTGDSNTPTLSATPSPSDLPTLEDMPFELTQSDVDLYLPTAEPSLEPEPDDGDITESPTWYVRPFTSRTPTRASGGGGGGGFIGATATPNTYYLTITSLARTNTARAKITNTFMAPTRQTGTAAARGTSTQARFLTDIARTPRPSQVAYSSGGRIMIYHLYTPVTPTGTPRTPTASPTANPFPVLTPPPDAVFGDWAPGGRQIVFARDARLQILNVNVDGSAQGTPYPLANQPAGENSQPNWSPNNRWIVFVNVGADARSRLYRISPEGARIQRLTDGISTGQSAVANPDWAPDSGKVVYISGGDIYTITVGPLASAPLQNQPRDQLASYSPSWLKRVFAWLMPKAAPPAQIDPADQTATAVFQTEEAASATAVYETEQAGTATAIFVGTRDAQTATAVAQTAEAVASQTAVVVQTRAAQTAVAQTLTAAPTSNATVVVTSPTRLTNTAGSEAWPHYNSDGKSILYVIDGAIKLLTPGRTPPIQDLFPGSGASYPFWSLDRNYLYGYVSGDEVYLVDQYGNAVAVTGSGDPKENPIWRP